MTSSSPLIYTPSESSAEWTQFEGNDFDEQFAQLVIQHAWNRRESATRRTQAIEDDIISEYGTDLTKLEEWQKLCTDVDIGSAPRSINQRKKGLKSVLVNLVDLVNYRHHGIPIQTSARFSAFHNYTVNGMVFSKEAKKQGFIKILLREVFAPGM